MKNNAIPLFVILNTFIFSNSHAIILDLDSIPSGTNPFQTNGNSWHSGVGRLTSPLSSSSEYVSSCTAQAISPTVLITAAHCTNNFTTQGGKFRVDLNNDSFFDYEYNIQNFIDHPGWSNDGRTSRSVAEYEHDIALIQLSTVLSTEIPIYRLYPGIAGMPVSLVGYGMQGTGGQPLKSNYDIGNFDRWVGTNVTEDVLISGSISGNQFKATFDDRNTFEYIVPPSGCIGSPGKQICSNPGIKKEGFGFTEVNIAPGDSGGGVFYSPFVSQRYLMPDGWPPGVTHKLISTEHFLVGINSHGDNFSAYGTSSGFVDIFNHIGWINDMLLIWGEPSLSSHATDLFTVVVPSPSDFSYTHASSIEPIFFEGDIHSVPSPKSITLIIIGLLFIYLTQLRTNKTAHMS